MKNLLVVIMIVIAILYLQMGYVSAHTFNDTLCGKSRLEVTSYESRNIYYSSRDELMYMTILGKSLAVATYWFENHTVDAVTYKILKNGSNPFLAFDSISRMLTLRYGTHHHMQPKMHNIDEFNILANNISRPGNSYILAWVTSQYMLSLGIGNMDNAGLEVIMTQQCK